MAHELEMDPVTKEIQMFFYGTTPWHGLGQELVGEKPATAAEAIKLANLSWRAEKYPAYARINDKFVRVPGTHAVVREDTLNLPDADPTILTTNGRTVGDQYVPLQNVEAFSFFDSIVGDGQAIYHTAGALRQGDRIWILAKLPQSFSILGMDDIDPYLLLTNSHNGSSSIQALLTLTRVVCANTLRMAMSSGLREVKIRHTASAKHNLKEAAELLGIATRSMKEAETVFTDMARVQINSGKLQSYFTDIYKAPEPGSDGKVPIRTANNYENRMNTLTSIFERGSGADLQTTRGTLFGAFNAVTDYVDHYARGKDADSRMESVLYGHGDGIKQRAFKIATDNYLVA